MVINIIGRLFYPITDMDISWCLWDDETRDSSRTRTQPEELQVHT